MLLYGCQLSLFFLHCSLSYLLIFTFSLMFQTNGRRKWLGGWGWEEKGSVAPFLLGMGECCMS